MLSICIPTYNYDVSVLLQTLITQALEVSFPLEILIRDDASTQHKVADLKLPATAIPITKAQNHTNLGRTATRALLAEDAQYAYLLFLDSDVLPKTSDFLKIFEQYIREDCDVIAGGIAYLESAPEPSLRLRWLYGHKREARLPEQRQKHPYLIVSANLCIKKSLFQACNPKAQKGYGLDNIMALQLQQRQANVCHIDNPVYHLGLETNAVFLEKSLLAIDQLVAFEKKFPELHHKTRLQLRYQQLKKWRLTPMLYSGLALLQDRLKNRVLSDTPSLSAFDLLRLHHYIKRQRHG